MLKATAIGSLGRYLIQHSPDAASDDGQYGGYWRFSQPGNRVRFQLLQPEVFIALPNKPLIRLDEGRPWVVSHWLHSRSDAEQFGSTVLIERKARSTWAKAL